MKTNMATAETSSADAVVTDGGFQEWVQRSMHAIIRLLAGEMGDPRGRAFNSAALIIVGGELSTTGFIWLADVARMNRKHVIHLSSSASHTLPEIALAYRRGDVVEVYENCMLCMTDRNDRVLMVPDSFSAGAFAFAANMKLTRRKWPTSFNDAIPEMKRAYQRHFELFAEEPDADWRPLQLGAR